MSIRDRIRHKQSSRPLKSEMAELDGEQIEVREMRLGERNRLLDRGYRTVGKKTVPVYEKLYPAILMACVFDPETGEKVFREGDEDIIFALEGDEVDEITNIAFRLSGMSKETGKELGKDSENHQTEE